MTTTFEALQSLIRASQHGGDPLADAVIAEFDALPTLDRALINRGIQHGRASLADCPPALDALLRQTETLPPSIDPAQAQRGSEAWMSIPAFWITVAAGVGALVHTYTSPTIAKVLMKTQNLRSRTPRRLAETALWSHQVVRPKGLLPGAPGYVHTLQVRLLHARVRAATLRGGWNVAELGMPVSQQELLRTWLDFTYVPFVALEKMGLHIEEADVKDLYMLWQGVAHLLGIEPDLYMNLSSQEQGARVLAVIDAQLPPPNDDARALTRSMLESFGPLMAPALQVPEDVATGLVQSLCRHIHGDALADALQVERSWTASLLPAMFDANRFRRTHDNSTDALRRQRIEATLQEYEAIDAQVHGDTTYQANAKELKTRELPVTPPMVAAPAA